MSSARTSAEPLRTDEIEAYLDGVRGALADLPAAVRDELIEDLPSHLAEVVADSAEPLNARLGDPAQYADELRAAAGVERVGSGSPRARLMLADQWASAVATAGRIDRRVGPWIGYPSLSAYVRLLRPAWWLLRGYVLAMLILRALGLSGHSLLPNFDDNILAGGIFGLVVIGVSIWLGVRTDTVTQDGATTTSRQRAVLRRSLTVGNLLLAVFGVALLSGFSTGVSSDVYSPAVDNVRDMFPYGPDGQPLRGVRLYDENGQQVQLGDPWFCVDANGNADDSYAYPLCGAAPFASITPLPTPSSGPSASPSGLNTSPSGTGPSSPSPAPTR